MQDPKVTVLMPAYNAEKYIETAIESILNQTYKDFEFIIVNDCSTDSTLDIIERYAKQDKRIKIISNKENQKIAQTLNNGLKEAKGKYIARLDADDWSYPERLEKQVNFMEENPDVVLSSGNMEICDGELKEEEIMEEYKKEVQEFRSFKKGRIWKILEKYRKVKSTVIKP